MRPFALALALALSACGAHATRRDVARAQTPPTRAAPHAGPPSPQEEQEEHEEQPSPPPIARPLGPLPILRTVYTYPTPPPPERDATPDGVTLLGYDPARGRAVFHTLTLAVGARGGIAREVVDAIELPGARRDRIRADYRVHVSGDDADHLGRFTGSWARDVQRLVELARAESLSDHWRPDELTLSTDRSHVVVSTDGRRGRERGHWVATDRGRLLYPIEPDGVHEAPFLEPFFTPSGDRVVYSCSRYRSESDPDDPVEGLCALDVANGNVLTWPMPMATSAWFESSHVVLLVTSRQIFRSAEWTGSASSSAGSAHPSGTGAPEVAVPGDERGYRFHTCLQRHDLDSPVSRPLAEPIRCWDDAWSGSGILGAPEDGSLVVFLGSVDRERAPRIVQVRLEDGSVVRDVPTVAHATGGVLLPELRVVSRTDGNDVALVDLASGCVRLWEAGNEGARLESLTWLEHDGAGHLYAMFRPSDREDASLVELDASRLFSCEPH